MNLPLTASDLERLAQGVRDFERLIINREGGYTKRSELIQRVEVNMPGEDEVIGYFVIQDEWVGFEFKGSSND